MSIIVAIEPDRRRASQLSAMARAHLRAELLVAATAAQAVEALDGRVPDVLLTAPLLPSHEEAAMAEHLRQLGPTAAHVQTLTIPLLAGGADRDRPVLSAFRRDRGRKGNRTEPEGCDPAVFAEQITEYLREAQERRDAPPPVPRPAPAPVDDISQGSRLATTKSGKSERLARLLAAAVEEPPDDFKEFLLPPAPTVPFVPPVDAPVSNLLRPEIPDVSEFAPDINLSRSSNSFTSDGIATFERDTARFVNDTKVKPVTLRVADDERKAADFQPPAKVAASIVAPKMRKRGRRAQPAQDEWGFFDPTQCAFPPLMPKPNEIRRPRTTR